MHSELCFDIKSYELYEEEERMFEKMDMAFIRTRIMFREWKDRLLHEEKGASDIVAIMVVIVILLAVAIIFKEQLEGLVSKVFEKATTWVEEN